MKSLSQHITESLDVSQYHNDINLNFHTVGEFCSWYDMKPYKHYEDFVKNSNNFLSKVTKDQKYYDAIQQNWDMPVNGNDMIFSNVYGQTQIALTIGSLQIHRNITKRHRDKYRST